MQAANQSGSIQETYNKGCDYIEELKFDPIKYFDYNCLTYSIELSELTGIKLPPINAVLAVPNNYVDWIGKNPSLVKFT